MSGFVKLDCGIVDSTIWAEPDDVLRAWIALLAKADAYGICRISIPALAILCRTTTQRAAEIVEIFKAPDKYSRSPENEGRRVEERNGALVLLNYVKHREITQGKPGSHADRQRAYRKRLQDRDAKVSPVTQRDATNVTSDAEAEAEAEAEERAKDESPIGDLSAAAKEPPHPDHPAELGNSPRVPPCPHQAIIALYHGTLPELRRVKEWNETRAKLLARRWREAPERQCLDWWEELFGYIRRSDFLMGRTTGRDGRPFDCDLEWLIRPTNFAKVIEGKYEDKAA